MIDRKSVRCLSIFWLAVPLLIGCQPNESNVPKVKENDIVVITPSPTPSDSTGDAQLKKTVEENLKKKNITTVTVEVKDGEVTLKGVVSADKYADTMFAAKQVTEKVQNLVAVK